MTERDKWGRIPATLVEIDQPLCALNYGEEPCRAGVVENLVSQSKELDDSYWQTTGTVTKAGARDGLSDYVALARDGSETLTLSTAGIPDTPTLTDYNGDLYYYMDIQHESGSAIHQVSAAFLTVYSSLAAIYSISIDTQSMVITATDSGISDESLDDMGGGWYRLSFRVAPADIPAIASKTFLDALGFSGASGVARFAMPQISRKEETTYYRTEGEAKFADVGGPCFNTLSSCFSPDTYTIEGLSDGYSMRALAASNMTYLGDFSGARNEGLFLEFYIMNTDLTLGGQARKRLIQINYSILTDDALLTVYLDETVGGTPKLTFATADGTEADYILDGAAREIYRPAVYLSRGGTMQVRGGEGPVQATPFDEDIFSARFRTISSFDNGNVRIADVLIYDYEAKPVNQIPGLQDLRRKGDLFGDALFYAKFNRPDGYATNDGLLPSTENGSIIFDALAHVDDVSGPVRFAGESSNALLIEPPLTLRFSERSKSSRLPETLNAIPSLVRASNEPAKLSVGGTNDDISALGSRDRLTAEFEDHPYSDILTDPYRDQRTYEPESQGTFWGKWFARNVYKEGFAIRYVSGYETEAGAFERTNEYNYIIEKGNGPDARGRAVIKGFDILQSLRADKAVYPEPSSGRLSADISDTATSMTLQPVGVGSEYPSGSFRVRVGGEGMDVTRSGDTLTINTRGLYGGADSHSEDDTVQVVARIQSQQVHDIANTIITSAVPELARNIPKDRWNGLASEYLPRLYSADITEPTGVEDLLAELTQTAPIYFYADVRTNLIELGVIREPTSVAVELGPDDALLAGKMDIKEFPKERIDEVWVYYRIRDAAEDVGDPNNYSQRFILVNPEEQQRRGRRSIKRIYTRWIVAGARDTAEEIAQAYISRFQNQPVRISFDLDARRGDIWLGDVVKLLAPQKQTVTGETRSDINYQVIEAQESNPGHQFSYMAQSYEFFAPVSPDELTITIQPEDTVDGTGAVDQIDLRELYDSVVATEIDDITFIVAGGPGQTGGGIVGGGTGQSWSMNIPNDWPWSPTISMRVEPGALIAGRGGNGGEGAETPGNTPEAGGNGQTGLLVRYAINLDNSGIIGGGGGGGGGSAIDPGSSTGFISGGGGGGGAGRKTGDAGPRGAGFDGEAGVVPVDAEPGTTLTGGAGGYTVDQRPIADRIYYRGGRGGDMAQAGRPGETAGGVSGGAGGSPGAAIDGVSNITFINRGDIRGTEIN